MLAASFTVVIALPASAQSPWPEDADAPAEQVAAPAADDPDMKDIDVSKLDWSQLNVDASGLGEAMARPAPNAPKKAASTDMTWSAKNNPNGASAVSVKQSLSPFWDTRVGADMTVAREPTTMSELLAEKTANGGNVPQSGGTAWAAITAPGAGALWDKTSVEARVDPSQDQSKIGASISKSVPLSGQYSLTLQNGYDVTEQGAVPLPGIGARSSRGFDTDQSAKLDIGDTGTSLVAGQSLSSSDDRWLRKFGAEQKLTDGVTISGSIGETAQGVTNKSVTAGFRRSW
ncbi:hypothetical protein [Bradyrhizobium sp. STM 3562]|uniref:hypothetical protein n=1 Tax=Bradyrhizobium sp. STM 3562 TaxID=578924 RepID=UPI00388D6D03